MSYIIHANGKVFQVDRDQVYLDGQTAHICLTGDDLRKAGVPVGTLTRSGYERVNPNETYYFLGSLGGVNEMKEHYDAFDDITFDKANYFSSRKLAEDNARAETLMRKLRRYAAENGGAPSAKDWDDYNLVKFFVVWSMRNNCATVHRETEHKIPGTVYFLSKTGAENAIDQFRDELLWYFTQYNAALE